ncbi:TetR/AcrR family transcriptional regulator [Natrinema versiforme]|uniref:Regulatory protein TetR n=1 Tax=Natrinema versiforme JCM 10478 TaxID=1227496 RepID=L9Y0W1_9EURY|nr:TetR/AcrR family transcriptional regulator [Natrinema versiforme]ELY67326.1 regulatory protein TetR [Natrinema versiforme JCM 10478]
MTDGVFEDPANTREEILAATYRCLRNHGYADLTMQKIGDELEQSPSLVYHHYENKDALVIACLEYLLEHFEGKLGRGRVDDPQDRLEEMLDWWFATDVDNDWHAFLTTVLELRAQAVHDPDYRAHFTRSDRVFKESLAAALRTGIDAGVFQECDPDAVAETLQTVLIGAILRRSSTDADVWLEEVHGELERYLESRVYKN